jgi:putative addiction module CopG family antidote
MTIHLKPETEALIQEDLQRGQYSSADEFVEEAVRLLHEEQELWAREVHEKIERAYGQFERGEFFTMEEMRVKREQRKAAWLAQNRQGE